MNRFWRIFHVRMAEANAGEGGGASASNNSNGGNGSTGTQSGESTGARGNGSLAVENGSKNEIASGNVLAGAATQDAAGQAVAIPEKYQVKKEDGSIDVEASSLKLAEAYGHLEKRMGSGDAPPKTAEEYQVAVPDALKDALDPKTDPLLGAFLKDAHAAGLTQKQMDLVMGKYFELAPQLLAGNSQLSSEECIADLRNEWKDDATFKGEVSKAFRAAQAYGGADTEAILADYGNDPRIIRMLSRIGNEMSEDSSLNPGGTQIGGQTVESLMTSEAYANPKHADHARVSAQVQAYFNQQAERAAKAGNAPLM